MIDGVLLARLPIDGAALWRPDAIIFKITAYARNRHSRQPAPGQSAGCDTHARNRISVADGDCFYD